MKKALLTIIAFLLVCLPTISASAQSGSRASVAQKDTGTIFDIEISTPGKASVTWKNFRDKGMYYGEATIDGNKSMIIIRDGFSYSLSPDIKVARKSKIELDVKKNPLASKYGVLADIPQIDPVRYLSTIKSLNAKLQGPTMLDGNRRADIYTLTITQQNKFPWNNFKFWIDKETTLPIKITYSEGSAKRTLTFRNIQKGVKINPSKFAVPNGYKEIFFEWD